MHTLGTKVTNEIADTFREHCNQEGVSISEKIRSFVEDFCNCTEYETHDEKHKKESLKPQVVTIDLDKEDNEIKSSKVVYL